MSFVDINELDRRFGTCETGMALRVAPYVQLRPAHTCVFAHVSRFRARKSDPSWDALYLCFLRLLATRTFLQPGVVQRYRSPSYCRQIPISLTS